MEKQQAKEWPYINQGVRPPWDPCSGGQLKAVPAGKTANASQEAINLARWRGRELADSVSCGSAGCASPDSPTFFAPMGYFAAD